MDDDITEWRDLAKAAFISLTVADEMSQPASSTC